MCDGVDQQLIRYGFEKRIMFGSDQMTWPDAIGKAVEAIEKADFLSAEQKQDILYRNAARFLRLSTGQIARHYGIHLPHRNRELDSSWRVPAVRWPAVATKNQPPFRKWPLPVCRSVVNLDEWSAIRTRDKRALPKYWARGG